MVVTHHWLAGRSLADVDNPRIGLKAGVGSGRTLENSQKHCQKQLLSSNAEGHRQLGISCLILPQSCTTFVRCQ